MKKLLAIILSAVMLVCMVPFSVSAEDLSGEDLVQEAPVQEDEEAELQELSISMSKDSYELGEEITINYTDVPSGSWFALYNSKDTSTAGKVGYFAWMYISGTGSYTYDPADFTGDSTGKIMHPEFTNFDKEVTGSYTLELHAGSVTKVNFIVVSNPKKLISTMTDNTITTNQAPTVRVAGAAGSDWVVIYTKDETNYSNYGKEGVTWNYWNKGDSVNILTFPTLPAGEYKFILFENGGYNVLDTIYFTVIEEAPQYQKIITLADHYYSDEKPVFTFADCDTARYIYLDTKALNSTKSYGDWENWSARNSDGAWTLPSIDASKRGQHPIYTVKANDDTVMYGYLPAGDYYIKVMTSAEAVIDQKLFTVENRARDTLYISSVNGLDGKTESTETSAVNAAKVKINMGTVPTEPAKSYDFASQFLTETDEVTINAEGTVEYTKDVAETVTVNLVGAEDNDFTVCDNTSIDVLNIAVTGGKNVKITFNEAMYEGGITVDENADFGTLEFVNKTGGDILIPSFAKEGCEFTGYICDGSALELYDEGKYLLANGKSAKAYFIEINKEYSEEEEFDFAVVGAQLRMSDAESVALRFVNQFSDKLFADIQELFPDFTNPGSEFDTEIGYGFVVIPTDLLSGEALTKDTDQAAIIPAVKTFEDGDGYIRYTACITDVKPEHYGTNFSAVPYITLADGCTIYGEEYTVSCALLADTILSDGTDNLTQEQEDLLSIVAAALHE